MEHNKTLVMQGLAAFVKQRPGLDFADYGDVSAYRGDARRITQALNDYRELERYVLTHDAITAEHIVKAAESAFAGRLSLDMNTIATQNKVRTSYTTGQYWPTEYRNAACAVLAAAIWSHARDLYPEYVRGFQASSNKEPPMCGEWLQEHMKARFSRGVYNRWFK